MREPSEIEVATLVNLTGDVGRRLAFHRDNLKSQIQIFEDLVVQCSAHIRNVMPEKGPLAQQHGKMLDEISVARERIEQLRKALEP
jgi:hypothetical protein